MFIPHHHGNDFRSYLSNGFQEVYIAGIFSSLTPISCGVPQGSNLGPLLFLVYINDVRPTNCSCKLKLILFADDTSAFLINGEDLHGSLPLYGPGTRTISIMVSFKSLIFKCKKFNYVLFKTRGKRIIESSLGLSL